MKCTTTELEIETIYTRIESKPKRLDLQPNFQRGEVWSTPKKRKLIDSILRGWRIPPIHVIENKEYIDEVLDGQQRLATIRDFMQNEIKIDGNLSPVDENIQRLDGLTFSELSQSIQSRFMKYSITIIRLTEFKSEEPSELFFRLNQPATLTSAEQRNAFIGETRNQIRELVEIFESFGANKESIGFSNSRMAYDDVISKFCYILETRTLRRKITSSDISERYRNNEPFSKEVFLKAKDIIEFFIISILKYKEKFEEKLYLNKATLFSWLIYVHRYRYKINQEEIAALIYNFENIRQLVKGKDKDDKSTFTSDLINDYPFYQSMFLIFNQRASMGSTDAISILYRDVIIEIFTIIYFETTYCSTQFISDFVKAYSSTNNLSRTIETTIQNYNWGEIIND
ncbi:DUF262 domain-containing protein [Lysinibacillus capsici]|uniref:DUF262 domain-containing protein n=1 Tax=Lysinibacillus capsici TaxID=2115968 RepID=UPI0028AC522C|nr:DUF262 domain-containing protein [Lysinibacillus capsici]